MPVFGYEWINSFLSCTCSSPLVYTHIFVIFWNELVVVQTVYSSRVLGSKRVPSVGPAIPTFLEGSEAVYSILWTW